MKSWICRLWVTLRSALSWTHWRQKKAQKQWAEKQLFLLELQQQQRMLLLEALTPMAEALHRLDSLQQTSHQRQHKHLRHQEDLLMEVLNSLQPPASQQIFPQIGPLTPPPISRSSDS